MSDDFTFTTSVITDWQTQTLVRALLKEHCGAWREFDPGRFMGVWRGHRISEDAFATGVTLLRVIQSLVSSDQLKAWPEVKFYLKTDAGDCYSLCLGGGTIAHFLKGDQPPTVPKVTFRSHPIEDASVFARLERFFTRWTPYMPEDSNLQVQVVSENSFIGSWQLRESRNGFHRTLLDALLMDFTVNELSSWRAVTFDFRNELGHTEQLIVGDGRVLCL